MLAIHCQHAHAVVARFAHDGFAGHDQNFLGRDGDVFARANGGQGGLQARRSDNGDEHNVRGGQRGEFQQPRFAGINAGRGS